MPVKREDANAMLLFQNNNCRTYRRDADGVIVTDCSQQGGGGAVNTPPSSTGGSTFQVSDISDNASLILYDYQLTQGFTDPEGQALFVTNPTVTSGTVQDFNGYVRYTPQPGFNGSVTLCYDVTDGVNSVNNCITFNVEANVAPVGSSTYTIGDQQENTSFTMTFDAMRLGFSDPNGDALAIQSITFTPGTFSVSGTQVTFNVPDNAAGQSGTVTWEITDGVHVITAVKQFLITATPNTPPSGSNNIVIDGTLEDVAFFIPMSDIIGDVTDIDGDPLSVTNLTTNRGTLSPTTGGYIFTPSANYSGSVQLTAVISDGADSIAVGRSFTVTPVYDPPVDSKSGNVIATADEFTGSNSNIVLFSNISLLDGITSPEGLPLSVQAVSVVSGQGTVQAYTGGGGANWYLSKAQFYSGAVGLQVTVSDTQQTRNFSRTIQLNDVLSPPVYDTGVTPALLIGKNLDIYNLCNVTFAQLLAGIVSPEGNPVALDPATLAAGTTYQSSLHYYRIVSSNAISATIEAYDTLTVSLTFEAYDTVTLLRSTFTRTFVATAMATQYAWPASLKAPNFVLRKFEQKLAVAVGNGWLSSGQAQTAVNLLGSFKHLYLRESLSLRNDVYVYAANANTAAKVLWNFGTAAVPVSASESIDFQTDITSKANGNIDLNGGLDTEHIVISHSDVISLAAYQSSAVMETLLTVGELDVQTNAAQTLQLYASNANVQLGSNNVNTATYSLGGTNAPELFTIDFENSAFVTANIFTGTPRLYIGNDLQTSKSLEGSNLSSVFSIIRLRRNAEDFVWLSVANNANLLGSANSDYIKIIQALTSRLYSTQAALSAGDTLNTNAFNYINTRLSLATTQQKESFLALASANLIEMFSASLAASTPGATPGLQNAGTRVYGMWDIFANPPGGALSQNPGYIAGSSNEGDYLISNWTAIFTTPTKVNERLINYSEAAGVSASNSTSLSSVSFMYVSIGINRSLVSSSNILWSIAWTGGNTYALRVTTTAIEFMHNNVVRATFNHNQTTAVFRVVVILTKPSDGTTRIRLYRQLNSDASAINQSDLNQTLQTAMDSTTRFTITEQSAVVYTHEYIFGMSYPARSTDYENIIPELLKK